MSILIQTILLLAVEALLIYYLLLTDD